MTYVDMFVVEWCCDGPNRGQFRVDTLHDAVDRNTQQFVNMPGARANGPWLVLGVFYSLDDAYDYMGRAKLLQAEYELDKGPVPMWGEQD